jgi:gluconolactonase
MARCRTGACWSTTILTADRTASSLTVEGNLYAAIRAENRPGIAVYNPEGKELAFIPTGEELPTNVGFGRGDESDVLYVTSGKSLYKIKMAKEGYQLPGSN